MSKYDPCYYKKNKKKILAYGKKYFKANRTKFLTYHRKYNRNNEQKRHNYRFIHYHEKKDELFRILGGKKCSCNNKNCWHKGECKIIDERCLQFDHINGKGIKESHTKRGRTTLYYYCIKHKKFAKSLLQVLCANCNWIKKHRNNENPCSKKKLSYTKILTGKIKTKFNNPQSTLI